jgi:hypothetical protein
MPHYNMHMKIYEGLTEISGFLFSLTARWHFRALVGPKVMSDLVAECLNALSGLAGWNEVILAWVLGHCGIPGNEEADRLARQVSGLPLQGPEPALGL